MGYQELNIKIGTAYTEEELRQHIAKKLAIKNFSYQIINKSLDARNKKNIHWQIRIGIYANELKKGEEKKSEGLNIEYRKRNKKVLIIGSGPAGFFAAYILQKSGFETIILERGSEVNKRAVGISSFENSGNFSATCNYSFGEGGAGTFSDGKLTSRSKHISKERQFILSSYIKAGAPMEIAYLTHPHVGSDNLRQIVQNLRREYLQMGGCIKFETMLSDLNIEKDIVRDGCTDNRTYEADYFVIAPGHSSYETYKMLMGKGVQFRTKNFALGSRAEHEQEIINRAQWGIEKLNGVKAAEYRLTSDGDGKHMVYTFCMCPGGIVVPATPYENTNIVNGMSNYMRNGRYANAACVATAHPDQLAGRNVSPEDALKTLADIENTFFEHAKGYRAPFCTIRDFMKGKIKKDNEDSSYPLGLISAPLWELLPSFIVSAMRSGLQNFNRKVKGYDTGILLGLESKTSSPIQVIRDDMGRCVGFENLFMAGEGSGYAGGIISSAADGVKIALNIISTIK